MPYSCRTAGDDMARTLRDPKLDSRTARLKLPIRREPYWKPISPGCALGYRRGPGTWIAKYRGDDGQRHYTAIGAADDTLDADGHVALSFVQAQEKARGFFTQKAREATGDFSPSGPYTVADAFDDYFKYRQRRGRDKSGVRDRYIVNAWILPEFGRVELGKLTKRQIEHWQDRMATTPAHGATSQLATDEDRRRRKASCNRAMATFRAALNHAYQNGKVAVADAWQRVRPYDHVSSARLRYLSDEESRRLINACPDDLRALVTGALLTGCRYGELCSLTVEDYHVDAGTVHIRTSKSGKPRHVVLPPEGQDFFSRQCVGRAAHEPIFRRRDGRQWTTDDQRKPLIRACEVARIEYASFHSLRHTYASRLVMRGVPLPVVAAQLGHSSISMVEKHYGHLAPSYVAQTVRQAFGELGIANEAANVVSLSATA
jgi:integrase